MVYINDRNVLCQIREAAIVPVVVLDDAKDAVATAKALLVGGVDVMEITFRTAAAADSIKAVARLRDANGNYGGNEAGTQGRKVLPGWRLRWSICHEGALGSVRRD